MSPTSRQLAAIMFTDIVGYTALMGKDSKKALEQVRQSKEIQKPLVEKYNGKWLKEMGDGIMARFQTALDAVNCSLEIQRVSRADFEGDIRIGIHLGDITIENGDVYGDGVNVASRLESISDPGGIYVSDAIEKAMRGQIEIQVKYLGEIKLKNIDYGVRTYALQGIGLPIPAIKETRLTGTFLNELKVRGVLRAGVVYILLSFLLSLVFPIINSQLILPYWVRSGGVVLLIITFPVMMYLAWHYEKSPDGFVKFASTKSWQNPYSASQRKPLTNNFVISLLIAIAIATFIITRIITEYTFQYYSQLYPFTYYSKMSSTPGWSPDGKWIVFSSNNMGSTDIWKKPFEGGAATQLTHSLYPDVSPAWSPDNKSIVFERGGSNKGIFQISVNGGNPTRILNFGSHPSWSPDASKLVFDWHGSIYIYDMLSTQIDTIASDLSNPPFAIWFNDNDKIIFWNSVVGRIFVVSTTSHEIFPLNLIPPGEDVSGLSLSSDGSKLVYSRGPYGGDKSLWEVALDHKNARINSIAKVIRLSITEDVEPALSPDGTKIAFNARIIERHLYRLPIDTDTGNKIGDLEKLTNRGKLNYYPCLSKDGKKLLMTSHMGGNGLLFTMDLDNHQMEKVTQEWGDSTREVEASMGKIGFPIFYSSTVNNSYEIFKQETKDGYPIRLNNPNSEIHLVAPAISPDEKSIAFYSTEGGNFNIAKMGVNKGDPIKMLTNSQGNEVCPTWSPDGKEIAYLSDINGKYKIWKMNFDGTEQREFSLPSAEEHGWSDWSLDGRWFYYAAKVESYFNIYKVDPNGGGTKPITNFHASDFGLPIEYGYTKFEVSNEHLILPIEKRSGEIYVLSF